MVSWYRARTAHKGCSRGAQSKLPGGNHPLKIGACGDMYLRTVNWPGRLNQLDASDRPIIAIAATRPSLGGYVRFLPRLLSGCSSAHPVPHDPSVVLGALLLLALVLRLAGMIGTPLIPEEAYYWMYAQHLSIGYYDHPPMVGWIIAAGTWIFGDNEFGVRILGSLLMLGASGLTYLFGRIWFGRSAGLLAAAMLHILPIFYGIGFLATMDSALLFFWALCLVGVTVALRRGWTWGWYVAGVALGGAMLSKYTGVLLVVGTMVALIAHPSWRRHLLSVHPYFAGLLAFIIFSPVIVWNAGHDWVSFRFQLVDRWRDDPVSLTRFLAFLGVQLLVATPVVLAGIVAMVVRVTHRRRAFNPRWLISISFAAPLVLVMTVKALRHEIHVNWMAPAYLSLMPGAARLFLAHLRVHRRSGTGFGWRPGVLRTVAICLLFNVGLMVYLLVLQPRLQLISAFGPWRELASLVERYEDQIEAETGLEPLIIADGKYRLASVLAFYRSPLEEHVRAADFTTSQWIIDGKEGLNYPYWAEGRDWSSDAFIYVDDDDDIHRIKNQFREVQLVYDSASKYAHRYQIAVCRGRRVSAKTGT